MINEFLASSPQLLHCQIAPSRITTIYGLWYIVCMHIFYFYLQNDAFGAISYTFTAIIMQRVVFCKYNKCTKEILYECSATKLWSILIKDGKVRGVSGTRNFSEEYHLSILCNHFIINALIRLIRPI